MEGKEEGEISDSDEDISTKGIETGIISLYFPFQWHTYRSKAQVIKALARIAPPQDNQSCSKAQGCF